MPKLQGPLFGLAAHGSLGRELTYQGSQAGPVVHRYTVPENPRSTAQTTQRTLYRAALDAWNTGDFTADDLAAWSLSAKTIKRSWIGLNAFIRAFMDADRAGKGWATYKDGLSTVNSPNNADVSALGDSSMGAAEIIWGTTPQYLGNVEPAVWMGGVTGWGANLAGLDPKTRYYWRARTDQALANQTISGTYTFRTPAT